MRAGATPLVLLLLLACGAAQEAPAASRPAGPPATLEDLARLARERAQEAQKVGRRELQQLLPDLSLAFAENREFVERAIHALARRGPDLVPLVLPFLDVEGDNPKDRNRSENLGRALEEMGLGPALPELLRLARGGKTFGRAVAVRLLGRSRRPEARPVLLGALDDPAGSVAAEAALALGELKAGEARERLIALLSRPDRQAREAGLRALTLVGLPGDLAAILAALGEVKGEETLLLLLELIARHGQGQEAAVATLTRLAAAEGVSLGLRLRSCEILGEVAPKGDREAVNLLRDLLKEALTPEPLRRQAAYTLNDLGDRSGQKVVLEPAERFVANNPRLPYAYTSRAEVLFRLGEYSKAARDVLQALTLLKGKGRPDAETWALLFRCYARLDRGRDLLREVGRSGLTQPELQRLVERYAELRQACEKDRALARAMLGS